MEQQRERIPLLEDLPADMETPVSAFLKLRDAGACFLLESAEQADAVGRYSFIGLRSNDGDKSYRFMEASPGNDPLTVLRDEIARRPIGGGANVPAILGGFVGYVGYEYIHALEKLPAHRAMEDTPPFPVVRFIRADAVIVFDHFKRRLSLAALDSPDDKRTARDRLREIRKMLEERRIDNDRSTTASSFSPIFNMTREEFCGKVEILREHIRAGDIFQGVLSHNCRGTIHVPPFQIYRALRMLNPSPYMYYIDFDDTQIVGSSPETMIKLDRGVAMTRPIAGTRPRGCNAEEDRRFAEELSRDEKERAEHLMLVDLARNDLGKVCAPGTLRLDRFFEIERFSHVMHLVSETSGRLAEGRDGFDLFRALFPAGTVTGAPKIRAMEILAGLERGARGPYAGAVGYFGNDGDLDMAITIRTIVIRDAIATLSAGAGIVADSRPEDEYQETMNKLSALLCAIRLAERGLVEARKEEDNDSLDR